MDKFETFLGEHKDHIAKIGQTNLNNVTKIRIALEEKYEMKYGIGWEASENLVEQFYFELDDLT